MHPSSWEIVILKPTRLFYTFLAAQLPEKQVPSFKLLLSDNTAYAIKNNQNEEKLINKIEYYHAIMFHHEITRWLGREAADKMDKNFIDFLCFFKMEFHSQIILFESLFNQGHQLLQLKPKQPLLNWMRGLVKKDKELSTILKNVHLYHLSENSTVMIKNFRNLMDIKTFLMKNYPILFKTEMLRMCYQRKHWPLIHSYAEFCQYFHLSIHTQLIHLP